LALKILFGLEIVAMILKMIFFSVISGLYSIFILIIVGFAFTQLSYQMCTMYIFLNLFYIVMGLTVICTVI